MSSKECIALVLLIGVAMGFCNPSTELTFDVILEANSCSELHTDLAIRNDSEIPFDGDGRLDAVMDLHRQGGELYIRSESHQLAAIEPHEVVCVSSWHGALEPGAYSLVWGARDYGYSQITFDLVERK